MSWALRLIVAVILLQTLFFKFTAAKESVYIFSTLGMEPWGRVGSGVFELVASILLLIPSTITLGAAMAMAATGSAILFHLFRARHRTDRGRRSRRTLCAGDRGGLMLGRRTSAPSVRGARDRQMAGDGVAARHRAHPAPPCPAAATTNFIVLAACGINQSSDHPGVLCVLAAWRENKKCRYDRELPWLFAFIPLRVRVCWSPFDQ